jgi:hypothetical protein
MMIWAPPEKVFFWGGINIGKWVLGDFGDDILRCISYFYRMAKLISAVALIIGACIISIE